MAEQNGTVIPADDPSAMLTKALNDEATPPQSRDATENQPGKSGSNPTPPPAGGKSAADAKDGAGGGTAATPAAADSDLAKIANASIEQATRPLLEKITKLESGANSRERQREAEDVRDDYIRENNNGIPREMLRKLLPATTDRAVLGEEGMKINKWLKTFSDEMVRSGRMQWVNIGGGARDGGHPPAAMIGNDNRSPQQILAEELNAGR